MRDQHNDHHHPLGRSLPAAHPGGAMAKAPRVPYAADSSPLGNRTQEDAMILRFRESERLLHWSIAIPFMVCWVTALILVLVYNPAPTLPLRAVFAMTHRISGLCLVLLPLVSLYLKRKDFKLHLYNIKNAWRWSLEDIKWLLLMGLAAINKRIVLPEQGKFNAAEKVNFMLVMLGWAVFAVTGVMMMIQTMPWFPWLVHAFAAVLVTPTMLGHIYMATINPETRAGISGMISGYVDRHWAKHHYALWYREASAGSPTRERSRPAVAHKPDHELVDMRANPQFE